MSSAVVYLVFSVLYLTAPGSVIHIASGQIIIAGVKMLEGGDDGRCPSVEEGERARNKIDQIVNNLLLANVSHATTASTTTSATAMSTADSTATMPTSIPITTSVTSMPTTASVISNRTIAYAASIAASTASMPTSTSVTSTSATSIPTAASATSMLTTASVVSMPTTASATPTSATSMPITASVTSMPTTVSATPMPTTASVTYISTVASPTSVPTTAPATSTFATSMPTAVSATSMPTTASTFATSMPTTVSATPMPTTASTASVTYISTVASPTSVPTTAPATSTFATSMPTTASATSMPTTASVTSTFATSRPTTVSATIVPTVTPTYTCNGTPGWRRVAFINMTDTSYNCPTGLSLTSYSKRTCGASHSTSEFGCSSTTFSVGGLPYSRVCGRIRGYQHGATGAFNIENIEINIINYVFGISLTHGSAESRQHIWTFASGISEMTTMFPLYACPCDTSSAHAAPAFVGNDYFCESGLHSEWNLPVVLYPDDVLWDGQNCTSTSTCCQFNNPPWFTKNLPNVTTDDIELRICTILALADIPLELIELYVQ